MEKERKWAGLVLLGVATVLMIIIFAFSGTASRSQAGDTAQPAGDNIFRQLFPYAGEGADAFEKAEAVDGLDEAYAVMRGGQALGYAARHTVQGYAGPIELTIGLRTDGTLSGIHVGGSEFRETEGLGAKAKDSEFTDPFSGKTPPLTLGKEIDGIAGATVTSRAVVDGVNLAAEKLRPLLASSGQTAGRTANASVIGYGGPVLVRLTLSESGVIESVDIGGARFAETEGVGSRVREKAFMEQFIGQTPPLALGSGIDAVSGATVSSQAAVDAVNEAAAFLAQ